jgi:hypothetical protein
VIGIAALLCLAAIAYGGGVATPSLFGDDWHFAVKSPAEGLLRCPDFAEFRPLGACWVVAAHLLADTDVVALHALKILTAWLLAALVYLATAALLPRWTGLALAGGALFLVSPTVYARNWITGASVQYPIILFLTGFVLLVAFLRHGGLWRWVLGALLTLASFAAYEMQFGLALGAPLFALIVYRGRSLARKLGMLTLSLAAVAFAVWRVWGQSAVGISAGSYGVEQLSLSPGYLLSTFVAGYRLQFQWSWAGTMLYFWPGLTTEGAHAHLAATVVIFLLMVFWTFVAAVLVRVCARRLERGKDEPWRHRIAELRRLGVVFLGGLAAVGLGYVPIAALIAPSLDYGGSHANLAASIGGSVAIAALLAMAATVLQPAGRARQILLALLVTPLVFLGMVTQIAVQRESAVAWDQQKDVWRQLFALAPDLADDTGVYLLVDVDASPLRPLPFMDGEHGLGFTAALQLFYANDSLHGIAVMQGVRPIEFSQAGIVRPWGVVPYDQAIMLKYEQSSRKLVLLSEVPAELLNGGRPASSLGQDRVLQGPAPSSRYRRLVE